jgi:apolipoprotein N-acyltransferase
MKPRLRVGLALLSGLLLWLSFPNPWAMHFEAWPAWLAWLALVPLMALLPGCSALEGFQYGFLTGTAFFLPGLVWITRVQPLGFGAIPAWCGLAAWCALFPAAFGALSALGLRRDWMGPTLWMPALWTLLEALREHLFSGFPWLSLGSSQFNNPAVLPLAALCGLSGLHFAVALGNAVACALLARPAWFKSWGTLGASIGLIVLLVLGAHSQALQQEQWDQGLNRGSQAHALALKVGVVQGGIDEDQAWNREYRTNILQTYCTYSLAAVGQGANLILWPESAFPGFFNENAPEAVQVKAFARKNHVHLLIGSTLSDGGNFTNSAVLVDPDGTTRTYSKRHLVPFGEYVPFRHWVPLLDGILDRFGIVDFSSGTEAKVFDVQGGAVAPLICYESVFSDLVRQGEAPDLLAVLTVDTWYGVTPGPVWHAGQAAIRAVENGCWVARSAATGISLIAAPNGLMRYTIGLEEAGVLVQTLSPARPTPWRAHGPWILLVCGILLALAWGPALFGSKKG